MFLDERWRRLAEILVHYSTRIQAGERVMINMMETDTQPLVEAVYETVLKAGAYPEVYYSSDFLKRSLMINGSDEQVDWSPEVESYGMEWADAYIGLRGSRNPFEFSGIPTARLAAHRRAMGRVSSKRNELTRWVLVKVPNEAFAQQAGSSLDQTMDFFFNACLRDWKAERARMTRLADAFQAAERVRIVGTETDLTFSTRGRTYAVGDGEFNMPDGEIFTSPLDGTAEGHVYFEFPGVYANQRIPGIRLTFRQGRVVDARSEDNQSFLEQILDLDEGVRSLGEFGVGLNDGVDRWTYEILFDEKIGGTIHLALGRAYAECGGVNQSSVHWDIVKDLRTKGAIHLDDRKVFEDGRWLL